MSRKATRQAPAGEYPDGLDQGGGLWMRGRVDRSKRCPGKGGGAVSRGFLADDSSAVTEQF